MYVIIRVTMQDSLVNTNIINNDTFVADVEMRMPERDEWGNLVVAILKAELKRRQVTYADLAAKLGAIGVEVTENSLKNKISRAGFSAVFLFQCLHVIGAKTLNMSID